MEPTLSNTTSKACGDTISSSCIGWAGPSVPGTCKGATLTDVITSIGQCSGCIPATTGTGGSSGIASCYTGNWVDFTGSIPLAGSGSGYNWTITNFGFDGENGQNNPQYKWTKEGDLSVRGSFIININVTVAKTYIDIPLVNIPVSCYPVNFNADQVILVSVDYNDSGVPPPQNQSNLQLNRGVLFVKYPTGILYYNHTYSDDTLQPLSMTVSFGGTRFNLA